MNQSQHTEVLFEISLAIGNSLNLEVMLKETLKTLMRALNGNGCVVWRFESKEEVVESLSADICSLEIQWHTQMCLPRRFDQQDAISSIRSSLGFPDQQPGLGEFCAQLPQVFLENNLARYVFALPGFGILLLQKSAPVLNEDMLASLQKLMHKLASAANACLYDEQLKAQIQSVEAANLAKSQFLANMSHEIRTPMNGVIGMLDLVLETELQREQREHLDLAKLSANHLLLLINHILDLSKIEAGKLDLQSENVDLYELIGTSVKALASRAWSKNIQIHYDISDNLPQFVYVDPARLRQVLTNLLGNSIKFTEKGEVRLRVIYDADSSSGSGFQFQVTDTGIGISQERLDSIFNVFEQVDAATNRKYEGTGLGLSITRQLVEMMGGRVYASSQLGQGSTFFVELPLAIVAAPKLLQTVDIDWSQQRVLVVDDEPANRRVITAMLKTTGVQVEVCASGPEAVFKVSHAKRAGKPYGVVLMDAWMPGMNGYKTTEKLITDQLLDKTRVLILTSSAEAGDAQRCRELGISGYMTKPLTLAELKRALQEQLSRREVPKPSPPASTDLAGMKVLLVEDNMINQRIAVKLLEKKQMQITVADNGIKAVDCFQQQPFDLILMDMMMPEMDGLEATQRIRALEKSQANRVRTPIVAMTANAMEGDKERCLAAGMDGYVSKPVRPDALYAEILKYTTLAIAAENVPTVKQAQSLDEMIESLEHNTFQSDQQIFDTSDTLSGLEQIMNEQNEQLYDWDQALELIGGEEELLLSVLDMFLEEVPEYLVTLEASAQQQDQETLVRTAHTLKGLLSTFCAVSATQASHALEQAAKQGENPQAAVAELKMTMAKLIPQLQQRLHG